METVVDYTLYSSPSRPQLLFLCFCPSTQAEILSFAATLWLNSVEGLSLPPHYVTQHCCMYSVSMSKVQCNNGYLHL